MAFKIKDSFQVGTKTVVNTDGRAEELQVVGTATERGAIFYYGNALADRQKDAVRILPTNNGSGSYSVSLTPAPLTASRTATFPDINITVVGTDAAQTLTNKTLTTPKINDLSSDNQYTIVGSELAGNYNVTLPVITADDTFVFTTLAQTLTGKTLILPKIQDSDATHNYNVLVGNLSADRNISLPALGADDTFVFAAATQSLSNKTLLLPRIQDAGADHNYIFAVSNLTADRTITLPLLGADDTFVFAAATQTLTNKTLTTPIIAEVRGSTASSETLTLVSTTNATKAAAGILMTDGITSTSTATGTLVVTGGVGISENLNVGGNMIVTGDLTVQGATTTINTATLDVEDKNIILGNVTTPTDTTADGGGISLRNGASSSYDFIWSDTNNVWETNCGLRVGTNSSLTTTFTSEGNAVFNANVTFGNATTDTITINSAIANNNAWKTTTTSGNTFHLQAYDNDAGPAAYVNMLTLTAGNTPTMTIGGVTGTTVNATIASLTLTSDLVVSSTSDASTKSNGALQVDGGISVDKDIFLVGSSIYASDVSPSNTTTGTAVADTKGFQKLINVNTQFVLDSWAIGTYRSAKYMIQMTQGSEFQFSEVSMIHDGTNTYFTEYGVVENVSGGVLEPNVNFSTDITGGTTARLLVTINDAATTNVKVNILRTLIRIYD